MSIRLNLSYLSVNDSLTLPNRYNYVLPDDDKALRANALKIWEQQDHGKWPVDLDKCVDSKDYDAIFAPDLREWRVIRHEWIRHISSVRLSPFDGYFWQFDGNGLVRFSERFGTLEKREANKKYSDVSGAYQFDKKNGLLYIKWQEGKQNRELVLKVSYYREKEQNSWQEVLVLHAFPHTTWDTPVPEILKRDVVYYETFIRSTSTETNK